MAPDELPCAASSVRNSSQVEQTKCKRPQPPRRYECCNSLLLKQKVKTNTNQTTVNTEVMFYIMNNKPADDHPDENHSIETSSSQHLVLCSLPSLDEPTRRGSKPLVPKRIVAFDSSTREHPSKVDAVIGRLFS